MTLLVDGMGVKIQIAFQANLIEMSKSIKYCITRTDKPTEYLQSKHTETFFKIKKDNLDNFYNQTFGNDLK